MEFRIPYLPWPLVWRRLWPLAWRPEEADTAFRLIHNILPDRGRLARFGGLGAASTCLAFPEVVETALHLFVESSRVSEVWEEMLAHVYIYLHAIPSDMDLSRLSVVRPGGRRHGHHAGLYISFVWAAKGNSRPPNFGSLTALQPARPASSGACAYYSYI